MTEKEIVELMNQHIMPVLKQLHSVIAAAAGLNGKTEAECSDIRIGLYKATATYLLSCIYELYKSSTPPPHVVRQEFFTTMLGSIIAGVKVFERREKTIDQIKDAVKVKK